MGMTLQQVVDRNYQWFIVQGHKKATMGMGCVYRTAQGEKCAVGCCLPDNLLDQMGHVTLNYPALIQEYPSVMEVFDVEPNTLAKIQNIHDSADNQHFHNVFAAHLRTFCTQHKLTYPGDQDG